MTSQLTFITYNLYSALYTRCIFPSFLLTSTESN